MAIESQTLQHLLDNEEFLFQCEKDSGKFLAVCTKESTNLTIDCRNIGTNSNDPETGI